MEVQKSIVYFVRATMPDSSQDDFFNDNLVYIVFLFSVTDEQTTTKLHPNGDSSCRELVSRSHRTNLQLKTVELRTREVNEKAKLLLSERTHLEIFANEFRTKFLRMFKRQKVAPAKET